MVQRNQKLGMFLVADKVGEERLLHGRSGNRQEFPGAQYNWDPSARLHRHHSQHRSRRFPGTNNLPPVLTQLYFNTFSLFSQIGGTTLHSFAGIGSGTAVISKCIELAKVRRQKPQYRPGQTLLFTSDSGHFQLKFSQMKGEQCTGILGQQSQGDAREAISYLNISCIENRRNRGQDPPLYLVLLIRGKLWRASGGSVATSSQTKSLWWTGIFSRSWRPSPGRRSYSVWH